MKTLSKIPKIFVVEDTPDKITLHTKYEYTCCVCGAWIYDHMGRKLLSIGSTCIDKENLVELETEYAIIPFRQGHEKCREILELAPAI